MSTSHGARRMSRTPATDRRIMGDRSPILLFPPAPKDSAGTQVDRAAILIAEFLAEHTAREIIAEEQKREVKRETHP